MSAVDDVAVDAIDFIGSLDRSVLGSFAVDGEALYLSHLVHRYLLVADDLSTSISVGDMSYGLYDDRASALKLAQETEDLYNATFPLPYREAAATELFYWWSISGDDELVEAESHYGDYQAHNRLALIASSTPLVHSYFAVGIWDTAFIERCTADGVDPELAASMNLPVVCAESIEGR